MSDEDEQKLFRKALEESPAATRWFETRLRRFSEPVLTSPPVIFTDSYSSDLVAIPAYGIVAVNVALPRTPGFPGEEPSDMWFKIVGMTIFNDLSNEDLRRMQTNNVRIITGFDRIYEHSFPVLAKNCNAESISSIDSASSSFQPGWLTEILIPRASVIRFEIQNILNKSVQFRCSVHGLWAQRSA